MKKLFEEYGSVIVVVIAIVALITLVITLMQPSGPMGQAVDSIIQSFVDKTTGAIGGEGDAGGSGGAGNSGATQLGSPEISISGSTLTIVPVGNATSYEVYNGSELLTTITGTTLDLADFLTEVGEYTIGVKATADGYSASGMATVSYTVESTLPPLGTPAENCTWEQIKAIGDAGLADDYFNVGDEKTITLDTYGEVVMEIVAFNADDKADGSGKAAITWISKGVVSTHSMYSSLSTLDGWESSAMRNWLRDTFYPNMTSEIKSAIVEVKKTYRKYGYGTKSCDDNLWIPSYREIFGNTSNDSQYETSGASYASFFSSQSTRIKENADGNTPHWWLRSGHSLDSSINWIVWNGSPGNATPTRTYGVVLGFCT